MMKTVAIVAVMAACVGGTASRAAAQDMLIANVPFSFTAAGKTYAPGKYELQMASDWKVVELRGPARNSGMAEVIGRLPEPAKAQSDSRLVFDKVGGTYVLSEMWLPSEEGYLFHTTPTAHSHQSVTIRNGRQG